jgi:hypothetical protein
MGLVEQLAGPLGVNITPAMRAMAEQVDALEQRIAAVEVRQSVDTDYVNSRLARFEGAASRILQRLPLRAR